MSSKIKEIARLTNGVRRKSELYLHKEIYLCAWAHIIRCPLFYEKRRDRGREKGERRELGERGKRGFYFYE